MPGEVLRRVGYGQQSNLVRHPLFYLYKVTTRDLINIVPGLKNTKGNFPFSAGIDPFFCCAKLAAACLDDIMCLVCPNTSLDSLVSCCLYYRGSYASPWCACRHFLMLLHCRKLFGTNLVWRIICPNGASIGIGPGYPRYAHAPHTSPGANQLGISVIPVPA